MRAYSVNQFIAILFLPMLLINITTSANLWSIGGAYIGQIVFWLIIGMAIFIGLQSRYVILAIISSSLFVVFTVGYAVTDIEALRFAKIFSMSLLLLPVGAELYGNNPFLLRKQLVCFLAVSIPILLCQILGVSSFFMYWNTEYAHDLSVLAIEEIGTFKEIPVYPTWLVGPDEVYYQIGQGRPVGLLYSNNVLSIFVAITTALTLTLDRSKRMRLPEIICAIAIVLTLSKTAIAATGAVLIVLLSVGVRSHKMKAMKFALMLLVFYLLYAAAFPGIFSIAFSPEMIWSSFLYRALDVGNAVGADWVFDYFAYEVEWLNLRPSTQASYSVVGMILKNNYAIPMVMGLIVLTIVYFRRLAIMRYLNYPLMPYFMVGMVCVITQLTIPYLAAPSFQVILGFSFFPIFHRMWHQNLAIQNRGVSMGLNRGAIPNKES